MIRSDRAEQRVGAVLFEVLVAMTILVICGTSWVALLRDATNSVRTLRTTERHTLTASAELRRVTLWSAVELEARTGSSRLGPFTVTVDRIGSGLFAITLGDTGTAASVLGTTVYADRRADAKR